MSARVISAVVAWKEAYPRKTNVCDDVEMMVAAFELSNRKADIRSVFRYRSFIMHASRVDDEYRLCRCECVGRSPRYVLHHWTSVYMESYGRNIPYMLAVIRNSKTHDERYAIIDVRNDETITRVRLDGGHIERYEACRIALSGTMYTIRKLVTLDIHARRIQIAWRSGSQGS
jgi:hypothetical protein